jgi:hypothetical protein
VHCYSGTPDDGAGVDHCCAGGKTSTELYNGKLWHAGNMLIWPFYCIFGHIDDAGFIGMEPECTARFDYPVTGSGIYCCVPSLDPGDIA